MFDESGNQTEITEKDRRLWENYNKTDEDIPQETLHGMFSRQVKKNPDKVAVMNEGKSITFLELDKKSNQVARYLKNRKIGRNDYVGILVKRRIETIVNIMGTLKAGAAYVPIEPEYPIDRREFILTNSGCNCLLDTEICDAKNLKEYEDSQIAQNEYPEDVAYVIYTSGSTGKPKGVVIKHKAASNTIIDINQKYKVGEKDRIIGLSSMCFDLSVYDIFGSLASGATLVQIPNLLDINHLQKVVDDEEITIWNSVPAIMELLIETKGKKANDINYWEVPPENNRVIKYKMNEKMRVVMMSGDWIPLSLPDKVKAEFPIAEVISLGGATEASIWSIYYPIEEVQKKWKSVPYGIPLANQKFYILNDQMKLSPSGEMGELYIGGVGVAEGYLNSEEKTKNAFIIHEKYGRLYRTGDYGVLHNEGYIEFLGRKDSQVKIRGHRIELGEIENVLNQKDGVKNSIVADRTDNTGRKYLVAYVVQEGNLNKEELNEHLSKSLPEYMVPTFYVKVDQIPLSPNGKVDRKALPDVEASLV